MHPTGDIVRVRKRYFAAVGRWLAAIYNIYIYIYILYIYIIYCTATVRGLQGVRAGYRPDAQPPNPHTYYCAHR